MTDALEIIGGITAGLLVGVLILSIGFVILDAGGSND